MRPTIWTLGLLIASSYFAHEDPFCWLVVAACAVRFIADGVR